MAGAPSAGKCDFVPENYLLVETACLANAMPGAARLPLYAEAAGLLGGTQRAGSAYYQRFL